MGILISAHRLEKAFASRTLFRGLTFAIEDGDRIGLIGPNGAGKSTMLRMLVGQQSIDGGDLSISRGTRIALLEQNPTFEDDVSVYDAILAATDDPYDYDNMMIVDELLSKLDLNRDEVGRDALVSSLSGGWKKRVALARELARKPDLLLLDEPTNHLDVEAIRWLEGFLADSKFATVTITHDRLFLQRVANRIFDLDPRYPEGLLVVKGEYVEYLTVRDELLRSQERREVVLKNTLRRETEWLRRGAKARTTKQTARIKRAGELGEEVGDLGERNAKRLLAIDFQEAARNPNKLIEAIGLTKIVPDKHGGDRVLFKDLDMIITPKSRLGLLGTNGCGKSTLIKCFLGLAEPTSGTVKRAEKLDVAYFEQHRDTLDMNKSVLRNIVDEGDYVDFRGQYVFARSYLDRFLFRTEQHDMPVAKLSGGEQARLRIAQMMLTPANILVLDEPTNDLDMATLAVLEETLADFPGAVILVTHDRYFLDQVSNRILAFETTLDDEAELLEFAGFTQWEDWRDTRDEERKVHAKKMKGKGAAGAQSASAQSVTATAATGASATQAPAQPAKKARKLSFKEKHELDNMEANIQAAEAKLAALQAESADPANAANAKRLTELYSEIAQAQKQVETLYARWNELEN
jgi:ABC transport system ATP-binding/permease protein